MVVAVVRLGFLFTYLLRYETAKGVKDKLHSVGFIGLISVLDRYRTTGYSINTNTYIYAHPATKVHVRLATGYGAAGYRAVRKAGCGRPRGVIKITLIY